MSKPPSRCDLEALSVFAGWDKLGEPWLTADEVRRAGCSVIRVNLLRRRGFLEVGYHPTRWRITQAGIDAVYAPTPEHPR